MLGALLHLFLAAIAPQGSYYNSVDDTNSSTLRATLHELIDDHQRFPYTNSGTDTWNILEAADVDPNNGNRILDLYKNVSYAKQGGGNSLYNREHTWPNSYGFPNDGSDNYPYTDCHQLFLADITYNGARDRLPFSAASGGAEYPTDANNGVGGGSGIYPGNSNWARGSGSGGAWEVWHDRRGDIARALFYLDMRYEGGAHGKTGANEPDLILTDNQALIASSNTGKNESVAYMGYLTTLLQWHAQDPPDAKEIARNAVVQSFQGNRNPFIDHPEWIACLYSNDCNTITLTVNANSINLATGGTVEMSLDAGRNYAGVPYRVIGTTDGTIPGVTYQGVDIPINPTGDYFRSTLNRTSPYLSGDADNLDGTGQGTALFQLPSNLPLWLDGFVVSHAFVVFDTFGVSVVGASNPADIALFAGSNGSADLVINEVDYDQPGTDTAEFIEIYNRGNGPADLAQVKVELWNGSGTTIYNTIDLSTAGSALAANKYLVIGTRSVIDSLPPGTLSIPFGAADNNVQNGGSNGDGIKLMSGGKTLDSMSYEAIIGGITEGINHAGNDDSGTTQSLGREPNGTDTNQNADDFRLSQIVTPGALNQ
ncbi:MAG: endonuclease [Planctomycetes bacterium]|nr:endonuclease [Planctomycetota bacterium]